MGSKISQLNELDILSGDEEGVVAFNGANFRFKLKKMAGLVSKTDLGLDQVDNTRDQDKIISDLTQTALDGKAASVHEHAISQVGGLQNALDGKSANGHHHAVGDVDGLTEALDGKAASVHNHEIANVNGLQNALDGKAASVHSHSINQVNGLATALNDLTVGLGQKAPLIHEHVPGDIEGLSEYVDQKIVDAGVGTATVVFDGEEW